MDDWTDPFDMNPDTARVLQNVNLDRDMWSKRSGSFVFNTTSISGAPAISCLFDWYYNNTQYVLACTSTSLYNFNFTTNVFNTVSACFTASRTPDATALDNYALFVNGSDTLYYDGTSVSKATTMPQGYYNEIFMNFHFVARTTSEPATMWYSDDGLPLSFSASDDYIYVGKNADAITGLVRWWDQLIVGKRKSMWRLAGYGRHSWDLQCISPNIGCLSNKSMIATPNATYWAAHDGIYRYDGATVVKVSNLGPGVGAVEAMWRSMNPSRISAIRGYYHAARNQCIWAISYGATQATHNREIVFQENKAAWSYYTGQAISSYVELPFFRESWQPRFLYGDYDGQAYIADKGNTDTGTTISFSIETAHLDLNGDPEKKTYPEIAYLRTSGTSGAKASISQKTDFAASYTALTSDSKSSNNPESIKTRIGKANYGKFHQFKFDNNDSKSFAISGFTIGYREGETE